MGTVAGFHPLYTGVNYVGDVYGSFADANSLGTLSTYHINATAITADFGIDAQNNTIYQNDVNGGYTESNSDIATVVSEASADGKMVMVRPLIDFLPANYDTDPGGTNAKNGSYYTDEFRNNYNPGAANATGANNFFASYQTMIVSQAEIAQANGAQLFDIGVELDQLTGPAYAAYWDNIITAVKAVYTGKLTYSAIWDDNQAYWQYSSNSFKNGGELGSQYITGNLATQVSFWSQMDYVGIDEYAPISAADPATLTLQDLIDGWTKTPTDPATDAVTGGLSLIQFYENISAETGKPLLFTELGYANSSDAAANPAVPGYDTSGNPDGATADPALQALLYEAFFDAWQEDGNSSLAGVYLWDWEPGGAGISQFSPQGNTAALNQIGTGFGEAVCYVRGTRILTGKGEVPVEALRAGDAVVTRFGGMREIEWIGVQRFAGRFLRGRRDQSPVRFAAGALGAGLPLRALFVSPGHSMLVGDVLVLARSLVNGVTITQEEPAEEVQYFQLDLGVHDCVRAEGSWSESFADGPGLRARFHNAAEFYALVPGYAAPDGVALCAPRPLAGPALDEALRPVVALAAMGQKTGELRGWLERWRADGALEGWALDSANPELPVLLELWRGHTHVETVLACQPRGDLREAGFGLGQAGFVFTPPAGLDDAGFFVCRAGDGAMLPMMEAARSLAA